MKASDYIVEYLISKKVTDVFGYPGGMVTHLMDSFYKYSDRIKTHVTYHEQGAAMAACGFAQASGNIGVAYATSGPGATNLITGICNAFFDSIPTLFITGNVNTFEAKGDLKVRQRGFQETDIVGMVKNVTKYAGQIKDVDELRWALDYAFHIANSGRKGPVLLDIPMNIFRAEINPSLMKEYIAKTEIETTPIHTVISSINNELKQADRPVLLLGSGVKSCSDRNMPLRAARTLGIPVVTSMIAVDVLGDEPLCYGFVGAYGHRAANFIVSKSDLVISIGSRMDIRQIGMKRDRFAPKARIIRIDIDASELEYRVHDDEISFVCDAEQLFKYLLENNETNFKNYEAWNKICEEIRYLLNQEDEKKDIQMANFFMHEISKHFVKDAYITTDVGQSQVWTAQSMIIKSDQKMLFSGGHGAMGYSLPASIGCYWGSGRLVYSINGDGGFQMNMQEMQVIVRENIPVKIIVFNNYALGMIRHFQEMYFNGRYAQTVKNGGYVTPDFEGLAKAYGLPYYCIENENDIKEETFNGLFPAFIEVKLPVDTYVVPKLEFGKPNHDQEPLIDRKVFEYLEKL